MSGSLVASAYFEDGDYFSVLGDGLRSMGIKGSDYKDIVFFCVGTSKCSGDSLGPEVGTLLKQRGFNVCGVLDKEVNALNVGKVYEDLKKKYPNFFVICLDSFVTSSKDTIGSILLYSSPMSPGVGLGKQIGTYGDCCIVGSVIVSGDTVSSTFFRLCCVNRIFIFKMANKIADMISLYFRE